MGYTNILCRLCLELKKPCKAHVIPSFLYEGMFNEKRQIMKADLTRMVPEEPMRQSGEWDLNILCEDCDNNIISQYEHYASKILKDHKKIKGKPGQKTIDWDSVIEIPCLNYKFFKLFLLSILWRASISNRPMFFRVDLGNNHEERLRKILYNSEDISENEYPICQKAFSVHGR